jgi:hypothetical protein
LTLFSTVHRIAHPHLQPLGFTRVRLIEALSQSTEISEL